MRRAGFTLLEVMIALAIALGAIAILVHGIVRDVAATNHMKQTTIATELLRSKLIDVEQDLAINGWGQDQEITKDGPFADEHFPDFHWQEDVVKIQLPTSAEIQQATQQAAQQAMSQLAPNASASQPSGGGLLGGLLSSIPGVGSLTQSSGGAGGAAAMAGAMGPMSLILGQFDLFKSAIEDSIRKVTVKITWNESGKPQSLAATEYLVDTKGVDGALAAGAAANALSGGNTGGTQPGTTTNTPLTGGVPR